MTDLNLLQATPLHTFGVLLVLRLGHRSLVFGMKDLHHCSQCCLVVIVDLGLQPLSIVAECHSPLHVLQETAFLTQSLWERGSLFPSPPTQSGNIWGGFPAHYICFYNVFVCKQVINALVVKAMSLQYHSSWFSQLCVCLVPLISSHVHTLHVSPTALQLIRHYCTQAAGFAKLCLFSWLLGECTQVSLWWTSPLEQHLANWIPETT